MELWPFQRKTVHKVRLSFRDYQSTLLQSGTGSGKTVMAAHMIARAVERGFRVQFFAHRRELVHQCADKLERFGLEHISVLMAGVEYVWAPITVTSIQTLWARRYKMDLPEADLIVLDEAHHATAETYRHVVALYPHAKLLGLTATPVRRDGTGLGEVFDDLVCAPSIAELTPDYLVPLDYVAPAKPDLEKARAEWRRKTGKSGLSHGDYTGSFSDFVMNDPVLIGNIVENWAKFAPERQSLVFAASVKHSIALMERFASVGVESAHVDGHTPIEERDYIFERYRAGHIQVLCNCMVCTEGTDLPSCSCVVLARPTKSLGLYFQMIGRGMRIHPGKANGLIIDHTGTVEDHGFVEDPQPWSLEGRKIQERKAEMSASGKAEPKPVTCPECKRMFRGLPACPSCGWAPKRRGQNIEEVDGVLEYVRRNGDAPRRAVMDEQREFYRSLKVIAWARGYSLGWAAHTYRERYGKWPGSTWKAEDPTGVPIPEALEFVRKKNLRYRELLEAEGRS